MSTPQEPQAVREYFDRDADRYLQERYVKPSAEQLSYLSRKRLALEMLGRGAGRVLDAGSGPGVLTADLVARGFQVYSVDLSLAMLMRARLVAADDSASVRCSQADLSRLPFKTGTFDAVMCLGVLAYVPDVGAALREIARLLRTGGTAVLQTSSPGSPTRAIHRLVKPIYQRVRSGWTGQPYRPLGFQLRAYGSLQLRGALEKAGFEVRDYAYYDFRPPLLERLAPRAALRMASWLQRLERSRTLGWLGEGVVVKAIRS